MPEKPTPKAPKKAKQPAASLTLAECQRRLVEQISVAQDKSRYGARMFDYPEWDLIGMAKAALRQRMTDEQAKQLGWKLTESSRPENLLKTLGSALCQIIVKKDIDALDRLKACLERNEPIEKSQDSRFLEELSKFVGVPWLPLPKSAHVPSKPELRKHLRWTPLQVNKVAKRCGFDDLPSR